MEENAEVAQVVEQPQQTENKDALQNEKQEAAEEVKIEVQKEEPLPKGVQKRIDRAVRQKYEAEAKAQILEERLRNLENQAYKPAEKGTNAPKLEDYNNIEEYVEAKAAYVADKRIEEKLSAREKAEQERNAKVAQSKSAESWQKRIISATAELPDYGDVVGSSEIEFKDPVVLAAIQESEIGPKIAYYLASNPDEADDIADMTGIAAVRAIGRLEAKLQGKTVATTRTPPPITPVGQKAKVDKAPEEMSSKEFAEWRKKYISSRGSR